MSKNRQKIHRLTISEKLILKAAAQILVPNGNDYDEIDLSTLAPHLARSESRMGIYDYNDAGTAVTPIVMTTVDTFVNLTNDGAGPATNTTYALPDVPDLYDTTGDQFDWSDLSLGDVVDMRIDILVTVNGNNHQLELALDVGIGDAGNYQLCVHRENFKASGTYAIVKMFSVYMGDLTTLNFPSRLMIKSDTGTTNEVVVNGWFCEATTRSDY